MDKLKESRAFRGIWIPAEVWLHEGLTMQEKLFLAEIDSLDNENGCNASNLYFAKFFKISKQRVCLVLKSLVEKGYITSQIIYKEGSQQKLGRVVNICCPPYPTKVDEGSQQKLTGTIYNKIYNKEDNKNAGVSNTAPAVDVPVEIRENFKVFYDMRKKMKSPMSEEVIRRAVTKLEKLAPGNYDIQNLIINESIINGWKGLFEYKGGGTSTAICKAWGDYPEME